MGEELFDDFADLVDKADAILRYSLKTLCLENPDGNLNLTQYTQPALYAVSALEHMKKADETGVKPDYLAGHSLGEYSALFAGGAYDFETGLRLVQKRGELMGKAKGGGMAAVIGLNPQRIREILDSTGVDTIDVANFNSPNQIILSGQVDDLDAVADAFKDGGARRYLPLNVSAAFHSRYMKEAADAFADFLKDFSFKKLQIPVIANVTARPHTDSEIGDNLIKQITDSVRWQESIEFLLSQDECEFEEIGPGTVLTKLVDQIRNSG
jgi:malonyl CoA-acyl carrier protein transacylase